MNNERNVPICLQKQIRVWIKLFIVFLVLSGVTAFPIQAELSVLYNKPGLFPGYMQDWLDKVYFAVKETNFKYPFLAYGTDWLAFAHIVIAIAFIGPLRDPVKNKWVIEFGMIACILVIPLAFIAGPVRQIPFFHRVIDCSFGIIGLIPLHIVRNKINKLENYYSNHGSYKI